MMWHTWRTRRGGSRGAGRRKAQGLRRLAGERLERRDCPAAMLSMTVAQTTVIEGETVVCTLRLSEPARQTERVFVTTTNGTATYGTDFFAPVSQQVVFAPGQTQRTVTISTLRDAGRQVVEGNETFSITARPTNPNLGSITTGITIADYVLPPTVSVADVSVTEGQSGTTPANFTVTLSSAYPRAVTVAYATRDGSATVAGTDYVAASGTLTFAAGETSKTVAVTVNGDTRLETDETFQLVLSNPTEARIGRGTATATVINDETDVEGFQITLTYANPALPAEQKALFDRAVTRVEQIIVGDVPGVQLANGTYIDDMEIEVRVLPLSPFLNGQAIYTARRPGAAGLPYQGFIEINSLRIGDPGIYYTIVHEMLHAVGFTDEVFTGTNTVAGLGSTAPLFTGANAVREFNSYFGTSSASVPLFGDLTLPGSYGSHWDTAVFGTEIMSVGWDTTRTDVRPFSRVTIGALQDIGYQVNYAAADTYIPQADQVALARGVASSGALVGGSSISSVSRERAQPAASSRPSTSATTPTRLKVVSQPSTVAPATSHRLLAPSRTTVRAPAPVSRPVGRLITAPKPVA